METGYRAILRLDDSTSAVGVAESEISSWLRGKRKNGIEVSEWDGPGEYRLGERADLSVVHGEEALDGSRRRLYRFRESNAGGTWTVSVYAFDVPEARSNRQTLVVDVATDAPDVDGAVYNTAPPTLVRDILSTYPARDGATPLTGEPQFVRGDDVDEVFAAITDDTRTASVIVAPTPWENELESDWREIVTSLTVESVGVASTYVLDTEATEALAARLPQSHVVSKGVIRTFSPRVALDVEGDRLRHRWLFPDTLARAVNSKSKKVSRGLARRFAESTRLRFIERELPTDVRRGIALLERAETTAHTARQVERHRAEVDLAFAADSATEIVHFRHALETEPLRIPLAVLVERWLGPDVDADADALRRLGAELDARDAEIAILKEQADKAANSREELRDDLEAAKKLADDMQLLATIAEDGENKTAKELATLRQRMFEDGKGDLTFVAPEEDIWDAPGDIESLIALIAPGSNHPVHKRVVFTGDESKALDIDRGGLGLRYAHAFWEYVRVLYDYAEGKLSGKVSVGVHAYLSADHLPGHKCAPVRHAPDESDTTKRNWGHEREFAVPKEVHPKEKIRMYAHFKPTWANAFAPRMHYLDHVDETGMVYIGYIGKHLTNTKT
ncbi:hypothetical protein TSOC111612_11445 [Tsukamurella ocularis]|uniref:hypothetical protein n=1 Tax=Tsukamurella ocularis TaxID=1970234 RepID=UPI0039EE1278